MVDVGDDVLDVFVDADGSLALFVDHRGELLENAAKFGDCSFHVFAWLSSARGGVVLVLVLVDGDLVLVEGNWVHVVETPPPCSPPRWL